MYELEKLDALITAIDRQQQINGVETYLQETLNHEKLVELTRALAAIERVIDPTSAEEIEENNSKRLAILESYMDELENSLPNATEEDLSYFLFEMKLSEEGVWAKYEQEQSFRKYIRTRIKNMRGQTRLEVEKYLQQMHEFVCKRETMSSDGVVNCFYGKSSDENGYWQFKYDQHGILMEYKEIKDQLQMMWQKRLNVLTEIKIGAEQTAVDRVIAAIGYQPIGKAEILSSSTKLNYGYYQGPKSIAVIEVIYDSQSKVEQKAFVR